jgi:hypothetical protein
VFKHVVEILEELDPVGLAARDLLRFAEILKILVISADTNWVFGTEEERATAFEAKNNAKEFLVVGVVIGFRWEETARVEGDGVEPILVFLGNDHS